jgi:hypothetical protein
MGQFDKIKDEEIIGDDVESVVSAPEESVVYTPSAEELQVKEVEKAENAIKDQAKIKELEDELINGTENKNEFGEARIDNPKILDMIAEIEYCHVKNKEDKEMMIRNWRKMIDNQYKEALQDFEDDAMVGVVYGNAGWDRFQVGEDGKVRLINDNNLKAIKTALEKAKELGMEILGSQNELN